MTATTEGRNTKRRAADQFEFPAAAQKLLAGTIAVLSAGIAQMATTATGNTAVGVIDETVDNSAGSAGDVNVKVRRGCFHFANSASTDEITLADVGSTCYLVDNQTVAKTDGSSSRSAGGVIRDVDDQGVWVEF